MTSVRAKSLPVSSARRSRKYLSTGSGGWPSPAPGIQTAPGTLEVWQKEYEHPRVPYIFNLRTDPYERANITSNTYYDWLLDHAFLLVPAQTVVGDFLATFKDYPPRQKAASFTVGQALEKLNQTDGD